MRQRNKASAITFADGAGNSTGGWTAGPTSYAPRRRRSRVLEIRFATGLGRAAYDAATHCEHDINAR